ncbi:hypothetical protein [Embleya hyalina]|uniref:Uncharacterized protein n=1 Tax=Embleya hyalina TaxID=516124 RepID=A0A401YQP9_9ACTN|nr:hypothetical protein [Embleya hyalina]GCD96887.1 hypothetical protein EHYA_04574 [Embleya hyalina]
MTDIPLRQAELIHESDEPVGAEVRRVRGGWAAYGPSYRILLFDADLRVRRRFPIPVRFRGTRYSWDVHPSGRWAVFSDTRHTTCVGPGGDTVWEADHPALINVDGDPVVVCAFFHPTRDELHVFPGMADNDTEVEDAGYESARWTVSLPDLTVTKSEFSHSQDQWLIFPDGQYYGASGFDGHDVDGWCGLWDEGEDSDGVGRPLDVHPDRTTWLGNASGSLYMNPLRRPDAEYPQDEGDEDEVATDHDSYDEAFFLDRNLVLAATREPITHELLDADNLQLIARVAYPVADQEWYWLAATGDGTWTTTSRPPGGTTARLRHWRLA